MSIVKRLCLLFCLIECQNLKMLNKTKSLDNYLQNLMNFEKLLPVISEDNVLTYKLKVFT